MDGSDLQPLKSVVYLAVLREQNSRILREFAASYQSLRKFHPDVPVIVYHHNLLAAELDSLDRLENLRCIPIAVDGPERLSEQRYLELEAWNFPELLTRSAKIDALLLTPGDTLFLDTDTEVLASLGDCFNSDKPWMHLSEGRFVDHQRNLRGSLSEVPWQALGWQGDAERMQVYDSGSIYVPQAYKMHLYRAKELLWRMATSPADDRSDNPFDEQMAISIALQEATDYELSAIAPRVYHYWEEKYDKAGDWYGRVHGLDAATP